MYAKVEDVILFPCPRNLRQQYDRIFTKGALTFLKEITCEFDKRIDELYATRLEVKSKIAQGWIPKFLTSRERNDKSWRISPLPDRLRNRQVDLGDVSPSNTIHFIDALNAKVQGVQVDFDDGHCPTWRNTIQGIYNVCMATSGTLEGAPADVSQAPILMLRPRAWNILEHHCVINGKVIPGPLFDFALLMYHCGKKLAQKQCGPFFYLSKIESHKETNLWNDMFLLAQDSLGIPRGTIKACVLIENICAVFEMEEILYSIREHALGLNCGIWDYCASIISKFGFNESFVIPDRNKYVNMDQPFLMSYMKLVVQTCHARGAPATGGMAAQLLKTRNKTATISDITSKVIEAKRKEIRLGVDGFLIYDLGLVPHANKLWEEELHLAKPNSSNAPFAPITAADLLTLPRGGVTLQGLRNNITVALLFIYHWFEGSGHFFLNGAVEDSATAEICRSQIWQWIRHSVPFDDIESTQRVVTFQSVVHLLDDVTDLYSKKLCKGSHDLKRLSAARFLLQELVLARDFPEFITTFLNDNHKFRALHNKSDAIFCKL